MAADIIVKATGNATRVAGNSIDLDDPAVVRLDIDRSQVTAFERDGQHLVVRLADGDPIQVKDFYQQGEAVHDLVLREGDRSLWVANPNAAAGAARFTRLGKIEDLLAADEDGSSALMPALLGVAGAGGLAAAAASGGGSSADDGDRSDGSTPDTTPPAAPTAAFAANGASVGGLGEPGALVQVRDASGSVIASATAGADGRYSAALTQPKTNGESVTVTQADSSGNLSPPATALAPDLTAPDAPTATSNDAGTIVTGTGERGAAVTVRDANNAVIGTATVDAQGNYAVTLTTAHADGTILTVTQSDAAGNTSPPTRVVTPDLAVPGAPTATVDPDGTRVSGNGEPGATVTVRDNSGLPIVSGPVGPDGSYTVPLPAGEADGGTISVSQTDAAGNTSPATTVTTPDLVAPDAPTAAVDPAGTTVSGTGEPGATVTVRDAAGQPIGTAPVSADGSYTVPLPAGEADGGTISVTQTDAAGNTSPAATVTTPDLVAPDAPTAAVDPAGTTVSGTGEPGATVTVRDAAGQPIGTAPVGADGSYTVPLPAGDADGGTISVTQTDAAGNTSPAATVATPDVVAPDAPTAAVDPAGTTVSGTGEPGATVTVRDAAGQPIGTAPVGADGSYTVPLPVGEADGGTISVTQTDAAGNTSPATTVATPDLVAPDAPTAVVDPTGTAVSGTGEPGATVTVRDNSGLPIVSGPVGPDGSYTVPLPAGEADGGTISVTQTDAAGNTSPTTTVATPDLVAPDAPTAVVDPAGSAVSGTGEPGATVTVRDAAGQPIGTAPVGADGSYTVPLPVGEADGGTISVTQTDAAGNTSPTTTVATPDLVAPDAPTAVVDPAGSAVSGTGEPGATVTVRDAAGQPIGTAPVGADGSYTVPLPVGEADGGTISVTQTDAAGNTSPTTTVATPDLVAPDAPTAVVDPAGSAVSGTGEPGATVTVRDAAGQPIGTAPVGADGSFTTLLPAGAADGGTISVTQTDSAGNTSPATAVTTPDLVAPAAPVVLIATDGATASGTGEPGATVSVTGPAGGSLGSAVVGPDGLYVVPLTPAQTNGELINVVQADPAGNASPTVTVAAPDLTAPDAPLAIVSDDGTVVSGTAEAGASIQVRDEAGNPIGSAIAAADGSYTATLDPVQANGELLLVMQTDGAGNASPDAVIVAPDITAPIGLTAAIDGTGLIVSGIGEPGAAVTVRDAAGTIIGASDIDDAGNYTVILTAAQGNGETLAVTQTDAANNSAPEVRVVAPDYTAPAAPSGLVSSDGLRIDGIGEPGATVTIRNPSGTVGTALVGADGTYSTVLTPAQANGQTLQLTQADPTGNVSPATAVLAPDITAPVGLTAEIDPAGVEVTGFGEAGATVIVRDPAGTVIGTDVVLANGTYAVVLDPARVNGETLQVTQADAAGNASALVPVTAPDLVAPLAPSATVSPGGDAVTGLGEPGATVTVRDQTGSVIGTGLVGTDGTFTAALTPAQTNGEVLDVRQSDPTGNASPDVSAIAPDFTAPVGLTAAVNGTGTIVTGGGEPGATVIVRDPLGAQIGTGVIAPSGAYAIQLTTAQANGETLQVTQTDRANNESGPVDALAPDITAPAAPVLGLSTDGATAIGTGEPGATVTVTDAAGNILGSGLVAPDGSYSVALAGVQANGEALTATQADAAGNVSPQAAFTAPDTTAPAAPTGIFDPTGAVISGTGEPGATIVIRDPADTIIGTGAVDARGNYSIALTPAQLDRQQVSVEQSDATGNVSPEIALIAPDLTAPLAPAGVVAADGASITGTGEAGATVLITDPVGVPIGSAVVDPDGNFTAALDPAQIDGEVLGLIQTDPAGNVSPDGSAVAPDLVLNTLPPPPTAAVAADGATVSGTGEVGDTIRVTGANGALLGTTIVGTDGTYLATLATPQRNSETLRVTQTDADGDVSPPTTAIAPDLTAPDAPTATIDNTGLIVSGTGEVGATVRIADATGTIIGTAVVNANGNFYTAVLTAAQVNGEALTVTQVDAANNVSAPAALNAPDFTAPPAPTATVAPDGLSVVGTGEPGATVTIANAAGTPIATALVAADGSYTAALATPQRNGELLSAVQTDAAGNASPPTPATAPDSTAPNAPTAAVDPSGLVVSGTGEVGATVTVRDPSGAPLATAIVGANGAYAVALPVAQLNGEVLQVSQADRAGNVSPSTGTPAPDVTAPAAPTGTVAGDGASVVGTGEPGATVVIRDPAGVAIGTALVAPDGSYTAGIAPAQLNGERLTLTQADPTGNVSPAVPAVAPDQTAPVVPAAAVNPEGTVVVGRGEPGATVTVRDPIGTVLGTALVASNGAYDVVLTTPQRDGQTLQVTQADAAGNVSPTVAALAPDLTAPAAPTAAVNGDGTVVTGLGEAGATVRIVTAAGTEIGTAVVAPDGTYSATLLTPQANGGTLQVTQADPTGNVSPPTPAAAPDITPPAAPGTVAINDEGTVVTGTGEPNATAQVRDADGNVIGTGTVAPNGSFAVVLDDPQTAGEALTVSQSDAAGNQSGAVPITAPADIDAFDNFRIASVDVMPTTTDRDLGTANYLVLVSLGVINLDAQVLAIPSVQFTVDPGHVLDAMFTYDATLNLGALSGYTVVVQRFDGANWVAVDGPGNTSVLELGLANGNLIANDVLDPGTYRAFVTFDGTLGLGVIGRLEVTGVDTDYTDIGGVEANAVDGHVIMDPGPNGETDVVTPQTHVHSVTVGGATTLVAADGTIVDGAFGTLVINRDGSYRYTPDANAAAIGGTETFTYTLRDPSDNEFESATLTIAVGSPDVTGSVTAEDDFGIASATFENVVTTTPDALDASFATPTAILLTGARTGSVTDSFTVGPNSTADVTLTAVTQNGLSLLPSYSITVTNHQGQVVGSISQSAVAGLGLGSGLALTLQDLPSGSYSYTVSSTNLLGTGYGTGVYVGQTVTHLDQFAFAASTSAEGTLTDNDVMGGTFTAVHVQSGGAFVEVGDTPVTIAGLYGTLTVDELGHYTYQPNTAPAYSAADPIDSFTYQLVQPNGTVDTAQLNVTIDINNGVAPTTTLAMVDADASAPDVPSIEFFSAESISGFHVDTEHTALPFTLEDSDTIEGLLGHYMNDWSTSAEDQTEGLASAATLETTSLYVEPTPIDPLGYLSLADDAEHQRLVSSHVV
ncbi:Ig-like domain-containing protein [Sphingomonas sp. PB2P19]|uniref:BapA/Bap/LapF family large adhesin n=1 Tax=Sphingomonas rhamnosi TaxID=3096156 RepID=UPI002FCB9954